jgi:heparan-sulfate lyase
MQSLIPKQFLHINSTIMMNNKHFTSNRNGITMSRLKQACLTTVLLLVGGLAGWSAEAPSPEIKQELDQFEKGWSAKLQPDDARFGIIRVLGFLNLDFPGLEKVKAAAAARQYDVAEQELLTYFKTTRSAKVDATKSIGTQEQLHADNALRHFFRGNSDVHPPVFRGAKIDWTGRAFVDGQEIHDAEWYFQFQRLTWWPELGKAYAVTGDEKYFREWRYELVRWAEDILPFTNQTPDFVSRGMETCGRCTTHIKVFPQMLHSKDFDTKTLLYFLVSFHDQAEHIPQVYAAIGNHRLADLSQVFRNSVSFPEFKRSEAWKNDALTLLPKMMTDAVYDDGMNKELVFSYHTMYIALFTEAYNMFRKYGYEKHLPPDYYPRILKMAEVYAMQSFPDFTICQFGDGWKNGDVGNWFKRGMAPFAADIPYFDYMASGGKKGPPPAKRNIAYPESGFYFFRSAWVPDAVFLPLKCGAPAEWHNQPDNGTFELFAYGRNLMTDSGCYLYGSTSPEEQRWRAWFRSTKVHQTLTLDNRDADRQPTHVLWSESDNLVALVVENQSYAGLKHRRTVLFIDNRYFLIHDEAIGTAAGDVRAHFQFAPGEFELNGLTARTRHPKGANLLVKTFPQGKVIIPEKEDGWISYKINVKESRPAWSWKINKEAGNAQVAFLTALIPYREGEAPGAVEASVTAAGDVRLFNLKAGATTRQIRLDFAKKKADFQ